MEAIRKLISSMGHTVKKTDVIDQFNKSILSLNNEVLPMLEELETVIKEHNYKMSEVKELSIINANSGMKAKDIVSFVNGIEYRLKDINANSNDFVSLLDKDLPDLISRDSISIKEASILNVLSNFSSFILFTSDIILYIVELINVKVNGGKVSLVKQKVMEIRNDMYKYAMIIEFLKTNKTLAKDLAKLSNDKLLVDNKDHGAVSMLSSAKSKLKLVGFIGSPIYHVKMWLVDKEVRNYEALKEKKKLTELKILELKSRQRGENDPKLAKAIEYHENKLEGIEYNIRKTEED